MKCSVAIIFAAALLVAATSVVSADVTVNVFASSAPNAFGSPSWAGYTANALYALENGLSAYGDSSLPTAYAVAGPIIKPGDVATTTFKSWQGVVSPAAPFQNELGNRLHFGVHVVGDGVHKVMLDELTFSLHSTDVEDSLVYEGDFVGYSYNGTTRYGIDWVDGIKGNGDDVVYTSGNGKTLLDEIVYVGVGNAWWPGGGDPTPGNPVGGAQAAMDEYFNWVRSNEPIDITCTYSLYAHSEASLVHGSATVTLIPAPGAVVLGWIGLGLVGWCKKRFA